MVLLVPTLQIRSAIAKYNALKQDEDDHDKINENELKFIDHKQISDIAQALSSASKQGKDDGSKYRLATLLAGCQVYIAPKPPKPEPTPEFKALMARLRRAEEERQYQALLPSDTRLEPESIHEVVSKASSQLSAVLNILFSIVFTALAVWYATSGFSNLGIRVILSLMTALVVALAEVVLYARYLERVLTASDDAKKVVEEKSVVKTWELGG